MKNIVQIIELLKVIAQIVEAVKGLNIDWSQVHLETSSPIDLVKLLKRDD